MNRTVVFAILEPLAGILLAAGVLTALPAIFKSGWMRRAQLHFLRKMPVLLRWVLVGLLFCGLYAMARPLRDLVVSPFVPDKSQQGTPTAKDEFDELKWMLTILAGFAVITSIAQVATAWFSALTYAKQAEAKLKEIELQQTAKLKELELLQKAKLDELQLAKDGANQKLDDINKVLESVKARYPLFYEVEEKRNDAHDALTFAIRRFFAVPDDATDPTEGISWMEDFYHKLDVEKRQSLLSVESFASIDLHPARRGDEVENLKLFAVFYHAKFRYEERLKAGAQFADLERAEGYLLLALKKASTDFRLHNELGNIYLTMWESQGPDLPDECPNYRKKAEEAFEESRKLKPDQQRAYYNLAYIQTMYAKRYDLALGLLKEAVKYPNWQKMKTPSTLAAYIFYNMACNSARIVMSAHTAGVAVTAAEAGDVVAYLEQAALTGNIRAKHVTADFENALIGDLKALYEGADAGLKRKLDEFRNAMQA